jgi:hypothetical protein
MFSFKSLGHFFASAAHDIKVGVTFLTTHQQQINAVGETVAAVVGVADPALAPLATSIERAGEAALGEVLAVVSKLDDAAAAKGASVSLDAAAVAEFKALIASIEKLKPGATVAPANL